MDSKTREAYLESRFQANYALFCRVALFAAVFGALFTIRNLIRLDSGEAVLHYAYYFTAYLFLVASSLFSRLLVSLLVDAIEPKALDDLIFSTFCFIFFNLVAIAALDSYVDLDFTGYIFGCLGLAFVYRGDLIKFIVVLVLGFLLYWGILVLGLGRPFSLLGSLPILAFTCFALYISQSREKARYAIFEISQQLEVTNERLQHEVIRDQLTSAYSRTYMHDFLNRELVSVRRRDAPMGLIVCNLDDFKRVNDRFGHHCGDKMLAEIATLLLQPLSNTDVVVRYDGAEFVIFLPGLDVLQARSMAETLGQSISFHDSSVADHALSASFGVTEYREEDTPDSFLQRGYQCLYRAQARGKNQCADDAG